MFFLRFVYLKRVLGSGFGNRNEVQMARIVELSCHRQ